MNIPEIIEEVGTITGHAHLTKEINSAVKAALAFVHSLAFFPRDLYEEKVSGFSTTDRRISIPLPARFKRFDYIKIVTYPAGAAAEGVITVLKEVDPPAAFSLGAIVPATNTYYVAGANLILNLAAPTEFLYLAYYRHPSLELDEANLDWIAADFPYSIIFKAASLIYKSIDLEAKASSLQQDLAYELNALVSIAEFTSAVQTSHDL